MLSKREAVALVLLGMGQAHNKPYCFPSQGKILKLSQRIYKVPMSVRTLNRVLRKLVDDDFIERVRRHRRGDLGQPVFCSTLYKFRGKLFNWVYSLAKRLRSLFSFYRVPKWAKYIPKGSQTSSVLRQPLAVHSRGDPKEVGPSAIKGILSGLRPHL